MIIEAKQLCARPDFVGADEYDLQARLDGIESLIRAYTNNNFQNRKVRFTAPSTASALRGGSPYLQLGDTVQISNSVNDGLYTVLSASASETTLHESIFPADANTVTKVEYPRAIINGAINLLKWDIQNAGKVGIQSETVSRHSVTYFAQDASNQICGYPAALMGFLAPYRKARF